MLRRLSGRLIAILRVAVVLFAAFGAWPAGAQEALTEADIPPLLAHARSGNGEAMTLLGDAYRLGQGVAADPAEALRFTGVDLLALSACETARGGGSEGEEIESFGALAQMNGASAVMATLWQMADESTATLMSGLYRGRVAGGLDKATALQRAP